MKRLHRRDLYCWSVFNERLNVDFNAFAWIRPEGNVLIDPLPMSPHDEAHLDELGGAAWILLTNSDHVRGTPEARARWGARLAGPAAERDTFPLPCDRWLGEGDRLVPELLALALDGSKTPGELALLLEGRTLITGDLVRSHRAGSLMLLRDEQGLRDRKRATASVARLLAHREIEAVLVGDGWCAFRDGHAMLAELVRALERDGAA
jgi:glyoxylase-like metal-dependent hydrolase (beta-lactamase superfamily II)